jgi:precorrin-2 dehydrogenase / sirohydrochlorin ferrochelatase
MDRMRTYPIMLDIRGRLAVVVGAGPVGLRKVEGLLAAEARVLLVDAKPPAEAVAAAAEVRFEPYRPEMLAGAALVFACTDQPDLNSRIAADARAIGALVNVADVPHECDFYAASVIRQGDVNIAIGTGGASPGLAAWLRKRLAAGVPEHVGRFAEALESLRSEIRQAIPDNAPLRMNIMKQLVCDDVYSEFVVHGTPAVGNRLRRLLEAPEV